jgi:cytoskeleton protein RodZ
MPSTASAAEVETYQHGRRTFRVAVQFVGAAALVAVLVFVYYSRVRPGALPDEPASAPSAAPATLSRAAPPAQTARPEPESSPVAPGAPASGAAQDLTPMPAVDPEAEEPPVAAAELEPAPPTRRDESASPPAPLLVVLTTTDACWLSIAVDGTRVPSRTLNAGERIEFTVQRSITMTAGNAGGLMMTLNGKPARSLGSAGEVVTKTILASAYEPFLR